MCQLQVFEKSESKKTNHWFQLFSKTAKNHQVSWNKQWVSRRLFDFLKKQEQRLYIRTGYLILLITVVTHLNQVFGFLEIVIINPKNHLDIQWGFESVVFSNRPTMNYTLNLLKKEGWFARIVTPHPNCLDRSPKCFPLAYGKWVH
jgi:hypothetical protein